ncbi:MAG: riboflavin synthase [Cyclobacteriaceae bacterium]
MFTGIIESLGKVVDLKSEGSNLHIHVQSGLSSQLKIDQSVSHNGVCLTVVSLFDGGHIVTAINETLEKTNLKNLQMMDVINLERCMSANGRFDGHIVQGHVDEVGKCVNIEDDNGSWRYDFQFSSNSKNITVEKGSICINGVSLTCFDSIKNQFSVAIIPYTYEHTNFQNLNVGDHVNLEFDIIGKYIQRLHQH